MLDIFSEVIRDMADEKKSEWKQIVGFLKLTMSSQMTNDGVHICKLENVASQLYDLKR